MNPSGNGNLCLGHTYGDIRTLLCGSINAQTLPVTQEWNSVTRAEVHSPSWVVRRLE